MTNAPRSSQPGGGERPRRRGLVLGALSGRRVGRPSVFVETLLASGADAELVIFTQDVDPATEAYLRSRGATVIPFRSWRLWNGPVHSWRFVLFARYAARHHARFDYILVSDLRDVIIQSDPFAVAGEGPVNFYRENAADTLGTNHHYAKWIRLFAPRSMRAALHDKPLCCCGVILGGAPQMSAYLTALARRLNRVPLFLRQRIGADSMMHNIIAHVTHDVPGVLVENNQAVATMGLEPKDTYHVAADGSIACANGHEPAICHQFDRWPELVAQSRYAGLA